MDVHSSGYVTAWKLLINSYRRKFLSRLPTGESNTIAVPPFGYDVKTGEVKGKEQRFFHVKLSSPKNDEATIEELVKLSRTLKALIHDAGGQPETLWNDVSLFYSERAYALVHRIENLIGSS